MVPAVASHTTAASWPIIITLRAVYGLSLLYYEAAAIPAERRSGGGEITDFSSKIHHKISKYRKKSTHYKLIFKKNTSYSTLVLF